MFALIPFIYL